MDDELPSLPPHGSGPSNNTIPYNPIRKRVHANSFATPSSDPPFFSSDDNPDADNYSRDRKKARFRGPWYQQERQLEYESQESLEHNPSRKTERKFERKYDSGVYMQSDGTDYDESQLENEALLAGEEMQESVLPLRQTLLPERTPEDIRVQGVIQRCLEEGNERIDLSGMGICTLSNATIRPLSTFTIIPPVSQDVFHHLEPNLKIFLSSNSLATLPEELFQLDRLTALSLRGNSLCELPPSIGKLVNLKELNISLNQLEYLPYEILDLFTENSQMKSLSIHPNPFLEFQPSPPNAQLSNLISPEPKVRRNAIIGHTITTWSPRWRLSFKCRSEVRYFDKYGALVKGPTVGREENRSDEMYEKSHLIPTADITSASIPPTPSGAFSSRAPSLMEIALKSCLQSPQLPQLRSLLPPDSPDHMHALIDRVVAQKESGIGKCTICKRAFVVKRTEWFEWWRIALVRDGAAKTAVVRNARDSVESRVPLVRRGCSWFCVPERVVEAVDDGEEVTGDGM